MMDINVKTCYINRRPSQVLQDKKKEKKKHTANIQSHFQCWQTDHIIEKVANATTVSQPTVMNAMFKAKLPFSSPNAASVKKSITGFSWKDLLLYSVAQTKAFCQKPLEARYEIPSRKCLTKMRCEERWKIRSSLQRKMCSPAIGGLQGPRSPPWQSLPILMITSG